MNVNNLENVTNEEFKNKAKKRNEWQISDDKLNDAAGFAIIEAMKWDSASKILCQNDRLKSQAIVNALFAIELYLKVILLCMGINVTTKREGHNIYDMYLKMDSSVKKELEKNIKIDNVIQKQILDEVVVFNTFEEELIYISNDFMYLRYEYEKFINGAQIIILPNFVMQFKSNCAEQARKIFYKK